MNAGTALIVLAPAFALGSFLNVVAIRLPARRSLLRPPSACGSCGEEILWRDNIPVLSYFLLRGRCRHCGVTISPVYPLVETATAALVVACAAVFGPTPEAALATGFCAVLVALSVIDVRQCIVPNRIVLPAALVALIAHTAIDPTPAWALWAVAAAGALFLVVLVHPKGLGMGEVKLAFLLGTVLGASVCVALMLGLFAALVPATALLVRHGGDARKMGVPLVPSLGLGAIVALFAGESSLNAYLGLF